MCIGRVEVVENAVQFIDKIYENRFRFHVLFGNFGDTNNTDKFSVSRENLSEYWEILHTNDDLIYGKWWIGIGHHFLLKADV